LNTASDLNADLTCFGCDCFASIQLTCAVEKVLIRNTGTHTSCVCNYRRVCALVALEGGCGCRSKIYSKFSIRHTAVNNFLVVANFQSMNLRKTLETFL